MVVTESIKISKKLKNRLDKLKIHNRQPYEEVIENLIESKRRIKNENK